ncbi:MAG: SDR family oxidoreductase [Clostridiales bacterium]|nr:SDR family oxidoreductase [Clostridiales bacterium]
MKLLEGKTAIMTGCAGGIGAACVRAAVREGAKYLLIVDVDIEGAKKTAAMINEEAGREVCDAIRADVSNEEDVKNVFKYFAEKQPQLDILLNNAGLCAAIPMNDLTMKRWDLTMNVNIKGAFLFGREAVNAMQPHKSGRIINMASQAGKSGGINADMAYSSSKGAMLTLTKSLAKAAAADQITVNSIAPGLIKTGMTDATFDYKPESVPLGRIGTPEEVADVFVFLASDMARYITGACIDVNGGILMD